ncbi:protein of unknown function [Taphrina deformans PYCC 5710]|uniref:GATA-type domain-containing protein n=1 Tax=Taphrina deformans (strain PYCC 5710 / ATCC 11124 / CBS 356.35 / IMI 108563 / JCM 9778 / NBRC 8474) TaxID=1097556 RepID=R4XFP2_TAPDE|nr:protein of unknown function [Taphrina deformans PYCC 5710]|eukprot:CCG84493.1 protein of unknown function [Taphrina deformans PYCC 5710]
MPFGKKQASAIVGNPVADNAIIPAKRSPQTRDLSNGPSGKIVPAAKATPTASVETESTLSREQSSSPVKQQEMQNKKIKIRSKATSTDGTPSEIKKCYECQATETSTWRRDVAGNLICNKCGLRKRKDHKAPSRRLIRKPKGEELDTMAERNDMQANDAELENLPPLKDPRPARPWITERLPSKSTAFSTLPEHTPENGSPTVSRSNCIPSAHIQETSPELRPVDVPMPRLPGLPLPHQPSFPAQSKPVTPSRRPGPKKALNPLTLEPKVCVSCGVDESPAWRKGPDGRPLCNKCMLRLKRAAQRNSGLGSARTPKTPKSGNITPTDPATPGVHTAQDSQPALSPARIDPRLVNRTDSQIVLDDFTHLNSSFASETNRLPTNPTIKLQGDTSHMLEHDSRNRFAFDKPQVLNVDSSAAMNDVEKVCELQRLHESGDQVGLASHTSASSGATLVTSASPQVVSTDSVELLAAQDITPALALASEVDSSRHLPALSGNSHSQELSMSRPKPTPSSQDEVPTSAEAEEEEQKHSVHEEDMKTNTLALATPGIASDRTNDVENTETVV